jgi:hypothetical protein
MNDSGIDILSPTLQYTQFNPNITTYFASNISNVTVSSVQSINENSLGKNSQKCDEEESEEEDEKENTKSSNKSNDVSKPPKPYLEIIADAILSSKVRMMQLHEIYDFMANKYQYFAKNVNKSWRNSVRHNLSLNECFTKAGRGSNGKGNYWKIHPLCEKEFIRGNFRRKTFKKLIKMGLNSHGNQAVQQTHPSNIPFNILSQNSQNLFQQDHQLSFVPNVSISINDIRYRTY